MAHAVAGLDAEPGGDHLVVVPHRAVEQHQPRAAQAIGKLRGHGRTAGDIVKGAARSGVRQSQADRIPDAGPKIRACLGVFQIQGHLAGNREGFDLDAAVSAVRRRERFRPADFENPAVHESGVQHIEDVIAAQDLLHPFASV